MFTNQTKHSSSFSNEPKNSSAFYRYLRHGKDPNIKDLLDYAMGDKLYENEETTLVDTDISSKFKNEIFTNDTKN